MLAFDEQDAQLTPAESVLSSVCRLLAERLCRTGIPTEAFPPFATPHKPQSFFSVVRTGPARVEHSLASV